MWHSNDYYIERIQHAIDTLTEEAQQLTPLRTQSPVSSFVCYALNTNRATLSRLRAALRHLQKHDLS